MTHTHLSSTSAASLPTPGYIYPYFTKWKNLLSTQTPLSSLGKAANLERRSMRSGASSYTGWEEEEDYQPHFLDSCSLCNRPLSHNIDIFMYRGNTPFCSQECRQEQIEMDEANERRLKLSSSKRSSKTARQNTEPKQELDSKKSVPSSTVSVA